MNSKKLIWIIVIGLVLFLILVFILVFLNDGEPVNNPEEKKTLVYKWDHMPLTYSLEEECLTRQHGTFEKDIEDALDFITNRTEGVVSFERIEIGTPDIFYICSEENSDGLFGEAHPFYYNEWQTYAPSKVYYYEADDCSGKRPIVMIHETLHMLGLDHGTNRTRNDIMRARYRQDGGACDRDITSEDLQFLKETYG